MHTSVDNPQRAAILPSSRKDPRATRILARSMFRDMSESGLSHEQILAVASELIGMVTEELKAEHEGSRGNA